MEYRITRDELENDWLYRTLQALDRCMSGYGLPLYVVGARARDIAMKLMNVSEPKRRTEDLDIAIAIEDWKTFDSICQTLEENHFIRSGSTQKFFYQGEDGDIDFEVDIVPFGGVAEDEKISWPPEGNPVMSVMCFQDVMKEAVPVVIGEEIKVMMAPLCGQFLIKLDTWNDRHAATDKDAEDMLYILRNYLDIRLLSSEDNVPPECVTFDDESTDPIIWGAQWLASDISRVLTLEHLRFYDTLIREEIGKNEKSPLVFHFMKYYGSSDVVDMSGIYDMCRNILIAFESVISKEIEDRQNGD